MLNTPVAQYNYIIGTAALSSYASRRSNNVSNDNRREYTVVENEQLIDIELKKALLQEKLDTVLGFSIMAGIILFIITMGIAASIEMVERNKYRKRR